MSEECLRTGIYVYEPTTVTIDTTEPGLKLAQLNGPLDFATLGTSTRDRRQLFLPVGDDYSCRSLGSS